MNRKTIVMGILAIGLASAAAAYYMYNKPHADPAKATPAFELSADSLFNAFDRDEAAANQVFLDKTIAVQGQIGEVAESGEGKITLVLNAENAMMGGVTATLADDHTKAVSNYSAGDRIKVKGRCTGMLMEVVLVDCVILE